MHGEWLCISIDPTDLRVEDADTTIRSEMSSVFGKDCEVLIIGEKISPEHFELKVENYIFVKVKKEDYPNYVDKMKRSKLIVSVLDSYENPSFLSDEEINKFDKGVSEKVEGAEPKVGDVVFVKEGYLKNLSGVVTKALSKNRFRVLFKLFSRKKFCETIWSKNLTVHTHIGEMVKKHYDELKNRKIFVAHRIKRKSKKRKFIWRKKVKYKKHRRVGRPRKVGRPKKKVLRRKRGRPKKQ